MIKTGLVSVTFRNLSPDEIIGVIAEAGLDGIEWGGDVHVPHGDIKTAEEVGDKTRAAGLEVSAYGSYFRLNHSEADGLNFSSVLQSAKALGTSVIRVWAGQMGSDKADEDYRRAAAEEAKRIADAAAVEGIRIGFEYHGNTLTDTFDSAKDLLTSIDHQNVGTFWQPDFSISSQQNCRNLGQLEQWLIYVHTHHFAFTDDGREQRPLAEGDEDWRSYLSVVEGTEKDHYVEIEFVAGGTTEQLLADAETLKGWLAADD